jgi:hypothetical protein
MRLCPTCERPRIEGSRTCSGCGRPYPAGLANLTDIAGFSRGRGAARTPFRPAVLVAVVIVLLAGGGGVAWLIGRHKPASVTGPAPATTALAAPPATPAPSGSPAPSPSPSSADSGPGLVTVASSAAQDPQAQSVAAFLDSYFTAINSHRYDAYQALFVPQVQQGLTQAGFDSGYDGTVDSAVQLVNISAAADGDTQAMVEFTSSQTPDAANNEESCTNWSISLFLAQQGGGYLIDVAPPEYHAASEPC